MNTTAKVLLGLGGASLLTGAILEATRKAPAAPAAPGLQLVGIANLSGAPGQPLRATVTFGNTGSTPLQAQTVQLGIVLQQGSQRQQTAAEVTIPAILPNGSAPVQLISDDPITTGFSGSVQVVVALASGATATGQLVVAQVPAQFVFAATSLGSISVNVGDQPIVTVQVQNTGQAAGTPTIVGVTDLGETQEGSWVQLDKPSIAGGATASIRMQTSGPISAQFGGDTLGFAFSFA